MGFRQIDFGLRSLKDCGKWLDLVVTESCGCVKLCAMYVCMFSAGVAVAAVCETAKRRDEGASTSGHRYPRQHLLL